ncbi:MAG: bifunctional phosphoribosyl-AMP cyclohydrolase/phosphoribosyl-ATP diphosphatase HisIE [Gemmatimonadetes bacterium]|nr:bifunctional phosphoribosyl-AMP cyclohydrolase/phosphoribosyl-ATP diphosphatase HisIE [Gemmatimonadota bacterium]
MIDLDAIDFAKGGGLITVVAQDDVSGEVLMVAFADREAIERTVATGEMHYRSRSRGLWHKGATSGNVQRVVGLALDCDGDAVLARVRSAGPACHTGARTCFGAEPATALGRLDAVVRERAATAGATGYTAKLLGDRNLRLKKLGEEAGELAVACADGDPDRAVEEAADLVYHAVVALRALGRSWAEVAEALERRGR